MVIFFSVVIKLLFPYLFLFCVFFLKFVVIVLSYSGNLSDPVIKKPVSELYLTCFESFIYNKASLIFSSLLEQHFTI